MPLVNIILEKGRSQEELFQIRDLVMDCVIESLHLPLDDRNIRITEYSHGYFIMKPPYEILVEIALFSGRTKDTKKKLFKNITQKLKDELGVDAQSIFILLNEQPAENWGIRGGRPADEVDLGFDVKI
jgi:4-oxalocrotonate tautomerase family enzyme